eukprot:m.5859 g.5859  ORF g.5859 m.5859 type:complete len:201 (+) comp14307_c0_seq1:270-872(+)
MNLSRRVSSPEETRLFSSLIDSLGTFAYSKDFDKNGIVYYLGKNGRPAFQNPAETLQLMVTQSEQGDGEGIGCLEDVTGRKNAVFRTRNGPKSWMCFDFGIERAVAPKYYTLRHGGGDKSFALLHWRFEGSDDGERWTTLDTRFNDDQLHRRFGCGSWPVVGQATAVRFLRVVQTGPNASGSFQLSLGGFEVYGTLYENY